MTLNGFAAQQVTVVGASMGSTETLCIKAEVHSSFIPRLFGNSIPSHTTREPLVTIGLELATNCIQFYHHDVIAKFV